MDKEIKTLQKQLKRQLGIKEVRSNKPTFKQINFLSDLNDRWCLGYDMTEVAETWTKNEVSELIDSIIKRRKGGW